MNGLKTLICHILLAVLPPSVILVAIYVALDPFLTLREYDNYYTEYDRYQPTPNIGLVTIESFDKHYPQEQYNSFIFGSSYSMNYLIEDWKTYIPDDVRSMHFQSVGESLNSLRLKLLYLIKNGVEIKYALIVLGPRTFEFVEHENVMYQNHWRIDPDRSWIKYQLLAFQQFYSRDYVHSYIISNIDREVGRKYRTEFTTDQFLHNPVTNEYTFYKAELEIANNPSEYLIRHNIDRHLGTPPQEYHSCVTDHSASDAQAVAEILRQAGTDYIVVIGPRIDRRYIHPRDLKIIQGAFGADRVFDFSREMVGVADSLNAYYDNEGHYRPWVAREIMRRAYSRRAALSDGD